MPEAKFTLHCGGQQVDRLDVYRTTTPRPTETFYPIPHKDILESFELALDGLGYRITAEAHALARDGLRYMGLLELHSEYSDHSTVVGVLNAHDRSRSIRGLVGSRVWVCDNQSYTAEYEVRRAHTKNAPRDLPLIVGNLVNNIRAAELEQEWRIETYKTTEIGQKTAHSLLIQMLKQQVVPATKLPGVLQEWENPTYPEFAKEGNTAWRLYNAATEHFKGSLNQLPRRSKSLHAILDSVCNFDSPEFSPVLDFAEEGADIPDYDRPETA